MKLKFYAFFAVVLTILVCAAAAPGRYPNPPTVRPQPPPRPMRVRRDVATAGAVATNANGRHNVRLEAAKGIGTPNANVIASVAAAGNTKGGPVTTGGSLAANLHGLGASISKEHTPGYGTTLTKSASANVFLNENNRLDGSVFKSNTKLTNGLGFEKNGGSLSLNNAGGHGISIAKETIPGFSNSLTKSAHATLFNNGPHSVGASVFDAKKSFDFGPTIRETGGNLNWAHSGGHAANLGLSKVHDFGTKFNYGASSNLFTSADRQTKLDFNAGGSRWLNGPLSGRNDFNTGFGLSHSFPNWDETEAPGRHTNPPTVRPQPPPRPIRVRRNVATGGTISTNPTGGHDVKLEIAKGLGTADANIYGSVGAAGNTKGGPITTSGTLGANLLGLGASVTKDHTPGIGDALTKKATANILLNEDNRLGGALYRTDTKLANGFEFAKQGGSLSFENAGGHGISIAKESIPGFSDTLSKSAHATLFNNSVHSVGANVFDTKKSFDFGPTFRETGGNLNWAHTDGLGANLGLSKVHDFGTKLNLGASSNLFKSSDGLTTLDFNAGGSRWLSGPFSGRNEFNTGIGLAHGFPNWG